MVLQQLVVQPAINAKVPAQQNEQSQQFNVQAAETRADITRINAKAQSDAQLIVACGGTAKIGDQAAARSQIVTPNPSRRLPGAAADQNELTYQYIQAIRDLINSKNNVTMILGKPERHHR